MIMTHKELFRRQVVTENGGRIFLHDAMLPTAAPFIEDPEWRMKHAHVSASQTFDNIHYYKI